MAWRKPKHLQEWLQIVVIHRKKFFFAAVPVMLIVVLVSFRMPREYRTEGVFERSNAAALQETGNQVIRRQVANIRRTMRENILGRAAIENLIDDLNLTQGFPRHSDGTLTATGEQMKMDMVRDMQSRMSIGFRLRDDAMDLVTVSYTSNTRLEGPEIVNKAIENYVRRTRLELNEMLASQLRFFESAVDRARAAEQEWDAKKMRFEADNPGLDPSNPAGLRSTIQEKTALLARIAQELERERAEAASLEEWISGQPEFVERRTQINDPGLTSLHNRRQQLLADRDNQRLTRGKTEAHPDIIKLDVQISQIDLEIAKRDSEMRYDVEEVPNVGRMEAESRYRALTGRIAALQGQQREQVELLRQFQLMEERFYHVREEFQTIERNRLEARSQLQFWEGYLRRTTIALRVEQDSSGVRLLQTQRAQPLARPTSPTLTRILGMAFVAGMAAGGLVILLSELLDHSYRSVDQAVDELKLPVFGAVAEIATPSDVFRSRMYAWAIYPSVGAMMVLVLVIACGAVYLDLQRPQQFQQLKDNPLGVLRDRIALVD